MPLSYPRAHTVDAVEELAGVRLADPYRWLEEDTDEVRRWQRRQGELAGEYVREWPGFDGLHELVRQFSVPRVPAVPRFAGGRWFRAEVAEGASQARVLVAAEPAGDGRVLYDPMTENLEQPPFVSWISPSPDGAILAIGVCADGSEQNTIRLIDVESGRTLPDPPTAVLMDSWSGGAHWLPDSSGFFFTAVLDGPTSGTQQVMVYRRAPEPTTTVVTAPWLGERDYRMVMVSPDGRYAVAIERIMNPIPVAIAELTGPAGTADLAELRWRPFITAVDGTVAGHVVGDRFVAVTDVGAERGRLVSIALDDPHPDDPARWAEIVPESAAVLRGVTPVGDLLYLSELADTYARVRVVDQQGTDAGVVPLPGLGAIADQPFAFMNLVRRGHPDEFLFAFSSLTESWGVYRHRPGASHVEVVRAPDVRLDGAVVEDRRARSADGTQVPYHVVRPGDADPGGPLPMLIYAYGGYNVPTTPEFPGAMAAFVAAGGGFVLAHLRGGAELGAGWWHGGRMGTKQNCYDDLYAVAQDLVGSGAAAPGRLAVTGGSNGGLMCGVALTQRPDLWSVVVPRVPFLDVIGACREGYGRMAVTLELGDITDPDDVRRLAGLSPYHQVSDGTSYPAVFIDAGGTDPRCPPWHARKFAARLQSAQAGEAPVLLRVRENSGHGWATDRELAITGNTEWLAFAMRHLGLKLKES